MRASTVKEVNKRLLSESVESPLIVMGNPNWRPGVLGLVANSLMQSHGKPVFLWGREYGSGLPRESAGLLRGSCRSDGNINIVELMQGAGDIFEQFGGHAASGGFSITEGRVHELATRLSHAYTALAGQQAVVKEIIIDRELDLAEVSHAHKELTQLAPFGMQNTKPLFLLPNFSIVSVRMFGKQKDHLELLFKREDAAVSGISFFSTVDSFQKPVTEGARADIVGHVETDWRGLPRLRVVDVI